MVHTPLVTSDVCLTSLNRLREHIEHSRTTTTHEPKLAASGHGNSEVSRTPLKRKRMLDLPNPEDRHTADSAYCSSKDIQTREQAPSYDTWQPPKDRRTSDDAEGSEEACTDFSYDGALQDLFLDLYNNLGRFRRLQKKKSMFTAIDTDDAYTLDNTDDAYDPYNTDDAYTPDDTDDAYAPCFQSECFKSHLDALKKALALCETSAHEWLTGTGSRNFLDKIEEALDPGSVSIV